MRLIADSGSTKTDWCVKYGSSTIAKVKTQGINPFHMKEEMIASVLHEQLVPALKEALSALDKNAFRNIECGDNSASAEHLLGNINEIYYYGAGCTPALCPMMEQIIGNAFPKVKHIEVGSDLLGAAKALCGESEGIACILGTGANSCLYDGKKIVSNVSPMGYILGDEGSGAVIGKTFITELYKGCHGDFIPVFERETGLSQADIIQKVYREPMANRFLASLSTFISQHINEIGWIEDMIVDCFRLFFRRNVSHYNRPDLPVCFVGSIAFYYKKQLEKAATLEGYSIGKVLKAPL